MAFDPTRLMRISVALVASLLMCCHCIGQSTPDSPAFEEIDLIMLTEPGREEEQSKIVISSEPLDLWMRALKRPNPGLQRASLDALSLAHHRGMEGCDVAIPVILEILESEELPLATRRAAIKTLVQLEAKQTADLLANQCVTFGPALSPVCEPALIAWKSSALKDTWLKRLDDPQTHPLQLKYAIEGLGAIKETAADDLLRQWLQQPTATQTVKLACAQALGSIHDSGLTDEAASLLDEPASESGVSELLAELIACAMLSNHQDADAVKLIQRLANSQRTAVQSEALKILLRIDPELVLEFVDQQLANVDVNVRRTLAEALIWKHDEVSVGHLATLLDDVNPGLRKRIAKELFKLAQDPQLTETVINDASAVLDDDQWRGCEQAALLLVNLDHKPAGDRLVDLLEHPRGEVAETSAWGLRKLALKEHLPAMLQRATKARTQFLNEQYTPDAFGMVGMVTQLLMAFGQMQYTPAEPLLMQYIPESMALGDDPRAAAAWALGFFYQENPPGNLVSQLEARLNDINDPSPETEMMRRMCAISLGRMKADAALGSLRQHAGNGTGFVGYGCYWAISQLTGESIPPPLPGRVLGYNDWFLSPTQKEDGS